MYFDYYQKVDRDAYHFSICLSSKRHISSPKGSSVFPPNIVVKALSQKLLFKVTFVTPFVMVYAHDVVLA